MGEAEWDGTSGWLLLVGLLLILVAVVSLTGDAMRPDDCAKISAERSTCDPRNEAPWR